MTEPRTKHARIDREEEASQEDWKELPEPVEEDSQREEEEKKERKTKQEYGYTWD